LFSSAATTRDWRVFATSADEASSVGPPTLDLNLDRSTGRNRDRLRLTITPRGVNPQLGAEAFFIVSQYGNAGDPDYQTNLSLGLVTN
jgi:hypothetical protein